jgi:hypothetical protein
MAGYLSLSVRTVAAASRAAQLDEDPSVPGARELVRRRARRRQVLVDRVAGVGVLHRVPRDCRRLFACSC